MKMAINCNEKFRLERYYMKIPGSVVSCSLRAAEVMSDHEK